MWPRREGSLENDSHSPDLACQAKGLRVLFNFGLVSKRTNLFILDLGETNQLSLALVEKKQPVLGRAEKN